MIATAGGFRGSASASTLGRRAFVLIMPATLFVKVHVVGEFFLPEALFLLALPQLLLDRMRQRLDRLTAITIVLALAWLWAEVASDIYVTSAPHDYLRGWANIGFTITNLLAMAILLRGDKDLYVLAGWGLVAGGILEAFISPSTLDSANLWKFGLAGPVTTGVALAVSRDWSAARNMVPTAAMAGTAVLNLILGFRSLAGICVLAASYLFAQLVARRAEWREERSSIVRVAAVCAVGFVVGFGFFKLYGQLAASGSLGPAAQRTYAAEENPASRLSRFGPFGILLNGRAEDYGSLLAIRDSPLIGHGSWAHGERYVQAVRDAVAPGPWTQVDDEIPTHSELLGAWVDAGVVGALFWFWLLWLAFRLLSSLYRRVEILSPVLVFISLLLIWDELFSPYGAERRLTVPYFVLLIMLGLRRLQSRGVEAT